MDSVRTRLRSWNDGGIRISFFWKCPKHLLRWRTKTNDSKTRFCLKMEFTDNTSTLYSFNAISTIVELSFCGVASKVRPPSRVRLWPQGNGRNPRRAIALSFLLPPPPPKNIRHVVTQSGSVASSSPIRPWPTRVARYPYLEIPSRRQAKPQVTIWYGKQAIRTVRTWYLR